MYALIITIIVIANGTATSTTTVESFNSYSFCEEAKAAHVKNVRDAWNTSFDSGSSLKIAATCVKRFN